MSARMMLQKLRAFARVANHELQELTEPELRELARLADDLAATAELLYDNDGGAS